MFVEISFWTLVLGWHYQR